MAQPTSSSYQYQAARQDTRYAASASPTPDATNSTAGAANQAAHQRTYQACIPCRRRKVRCDLGSVDNPHDPPCVRCRREAKECFFSSTRRKKKTTGSDGADDGDEADVYEIKTGRKRLRASAVEEPEFEDDVYEEPPRTPGGSIGRTQPLRRPEPPKPLQYGEEDQKASEQTTAILQAAEVHGGHDALKVLYEAAVRGRAGSSTSSGPRGGSMNGLTPSSLPPATSPIMEKTGHMSYNTGPLAMYQGDPVWKGEPNTSAPAMEDTVPVDTAAYTSAIKAWSRFRFVRAGWFTAREGIDYIEYFYKYLNPLTPVTLPDFRPHDTHNRLLAQEPMLAVTMLLIASRHMPLEGPGSQTRPYSIHQKLWGYLQGMIDRVVWGQEQFGGGFCGAGAQPGCDVNPLTRKGLRTLGTVESLMLLTEWHPRAMHFPPDEADDELMIPEEAFATPDPVAGDDVPKGIGGQRMDSWLEPCWRSDRMCWMLLGMAMSLAFEIGVFDTSEWQRHALAANGSLSADDLQAYDRRRGNVRDLLLIYVTQTSGRLGLTSMLPGNYSKPEDSDVYKRQLGQHDSIQETVKHFWLRMAALMRDGNQKLFANKSFTRDLIKNGNYKAQLEQLQPHMKQWRRDFDQTSSIPKYMRHILEIEYEYCRVYINALALQALAERCANEHPLQILDPPTESLRSAITTNGVRADVAIAPHTLAKWLGGDRYYIREVGDAARNLLKVVVEGLYPGGFLKHAPVRTYFRIISVAIMLLKSFSLGASETEVSDSLALMDKTVEALRTCIVDDVHVASRFADLLDTLTSNLKPRLIRISHDGRSNGRSHRASNRGSPAPMQSLNASLANQTAEALQRNPTPSSVHPQQHWSYNSNNGMMPASMTLGNGNSQTNPLFGISNDTYDLLGNDNNISLMPPPTFGMHSPTNRLQNSISPTTSATGGYGHQYSNSSGFSNGDMQDWLTLPLDPLLNISGADVNQTMYGPELGGQDMLELLLNGSNGNGF